MGIDNMRDMMIQQGYVPKTCTLDGMVVFFLMKRGEDPCMGCNESRIKCGGRPANLPLAP